MEKYLLTSEKTFYTFKKYLEDNQFLFNIDFINNMFQITILH